MSKTRRAYNKPNKIFGFWIPDTGWVCDWHPWQQWGKINPSFQYMSSISKRRRQEYQRQLTLELRNL